VDSVTHASRRHSLRRHRIPSLATTSSVAGMLTLLAVPAVAQDIAEIVVTAQRREQNVQDVPIAVTAFTAQDLQTRGLNDIRALSQLTPNVNLDAGSPFSGDTSVLSASIRGIGQDDFAFNLDPGVGVYLDGVYLARTIGANQSLLDVERIEILKGPQGTLFGRNTIGGAINIVTHTPGTEPRLIATATVGEFKRRDFAFTADFPVSEKFLTSISASSQVRDGYQRVIPYPETTEPGRIGFVVDKQTDFPKAGYATSNRHGGQNLQVVRGKALWHASDRVDVTFSADWSHQDQPAFPTTVLAVITDPDGFGALGAIYNLCISTPAEVLNTVPELAPFRTTPGGVCGPRNNEPITPGGKPLSSGGAPLGGAGYVGGPIPYGQEGNPSGPAPRLYWNFENTQTGNIDTTYSSGPSFAKYDAIGGSITVDWELGDNLSLKSITGWRQIDWRVGVDLDGTPETIQEVTDHQYQHQWSQEFQLSGEAFDGRLDYVAGLYYFQESGYVHDFVPFGGALYVYDVANDIDTKSYAIFTHMEYALTDRWAFTLGARYSRDDKEFEGGQSDLDAFSYKITGCYPPDGPANVLLDPSIPPGVTCQQALGFVTPGEPLRYFPAGIQKQKYNVFTPTVGVQFHASDDVMLYARYAKGFKAGGWTTRLSNPVPDASLTAFGPEHNKAYELGVKSQWFNNHLQANAAVFYSEYTGIQLNIQEAASPVLHNAGDAELKGAELEILAVTGTGFTLNLAAAYIDAKYTELDPRATLADPNINLNTKLPKTPKYKFSISPQYDFSLPNQGTLRLGLDYTRTAGMYNDAPNTPLLYRPATDNLNAAIHYFSPDDRYQVTLGGTNLTDDRYITVGSVNGGQGEIVGTYNRPREWYLQFRANLSP
jgi:Outer membrane receptor proteins, mostly Fe transport